MSYKTTIALVAVLAGLLTGYFIFDAYAPDPSEMAPEDVTVTSSPVAQRLFKPELGDVKSVVVERPDKPKLAFELETGDDGKDQWWMTEPARMKVASYDVTSAINPLKRLEYEISSEPGEQGMPSATEAGLEPARATLTVTDSEDETHVVHLGRILSERESYARRGDEATIYRVNHALKDLFKDHAYEYRDRLALSFDRSDAREIEVTDRTGEEPIVYRFVRQGTAWQMTEPADAKATKKFDELIQALSSLRVSNWVDDREENLGVYGLDPAAVTVAVTVLEEAPVPANGADEDDAPEDEADGEDSDDTVESTTTYAVHLSNRSPIGESTKVYARIGDEPFVATVAKLTADKLMPKPSEWRDMHLADNSVRRAERVELTIDGEQGVLVRESGRWRFQQDDAEADAEEVRKLLTALADLEAVVIEAAGEDPSAYGFDDPRARISWKSPGKDEAIELVIGDYTGQASRRMMYARTVDASSVAKVRVDDVEALLRDPSHYRDRTILSFPAGQISAIAVDRVNPFADGRLAFTLTRTDDQWMMTEPIEAQVDSARADALQSSLGNLRAESIVTTPSALSAYGLEDPEVTVTITHQPPKSMKLERRQRESGEPSESGSDEISDPEPVDEADQDETTELVPVEYQPPAETVELYVSAVDGTAFAKRADSDAVYTIPMTLYEQLTAEYRRGYLLAFDGKSVTEFTIETEGVAHTFRRADSQWEYVPEPDLPLDKAKVENLMLQVRDLKTTHYAAYHDTGSSRFGLDDPHTLVRLTLEDGTAESLAVSKLRPQDESGGRYARVSADDGVFLLTDDAVARLEVDLADLEADD